MIPGIRQDELDFLRRKKAQLSQPRQPKEIMTSDKNKPVTLITGDDEYLIEQQATGICKSFQSSHPDGELEQIDGMVTSVAEAENAVMRCRSALASPGLFSTDRLVWFKNVSFLADSRTAQSPTVQEALVKLATSIESGLPDGFALLITADSADKRRAFFKAITKWGSVKEFKRNTKSAADRHALIQSLLKQRGCTMPNELIETLSSKTGSDTRRLVMEIEKLCLYVHPATVIAAEDLNAIISSSQETAFYELANRFGDRDLEGAVRCLHALLFQKHSVMGLIAHLENTIRDMIVFREALDQGWLVHTGRNMTWKNLPPDVQIAMDHLDKDPRKLPPFIATRLAESAARFPRKRLDHCLRHIVAAHEKMVSTSVPPELILEVLLVRMLGTPRKQQAG